MAQFLRPYFIFKNLKISYAVYKNGEAAFYWEYVKCIHIFEKLANGAEY